MHKRKQENMQYAFAQYSVAINQKLQSNAVILINLMLRFTGDGVEKGYLCSKKILEITQNLGKVI